MKKIFLLLLPVVLLLGCSYEGQKLRTYFESPKAFIKDPHFSDYKEKRDALESQYLSKELNYVDYTKQMTALEDKYSQEIQKRESIISN
jgi:hypothetical protein